MPATGPILDDTSVDHEFELGAVYLPFMGGERPDGSSTWEKCAGGEPSIGRYSASDPEAINKQIAQMKESGISKIMYDYGGAPGNLERFREFLKADSTSDIEIEAFWTINRVFHRDLDIDKYLDFMREEMFSLPNYSRVDGRPLVQTWGSNYIPWHDQTTEEVRSRWGSLKGFASYIYEKLTVDGTRPHLISGINGVPSGGLPDRQALWNRQFDGVTTWVGHLEQGEKNDWSDHLTRKEEEFSWLAEFARSNGMDFIPMVYPGFNNVPNQCWGNHKHLPRSADRFAEFLELADEFRTMRRLNVATFNGWPEGHQIEPGTFQGNEYGSTYLDVISEFITRKEIESFVETTGPEPEA